MSSKVSVLKNGGSTGALTGRSEHPVTVPDFLSARARGCRLTMLTCYDYTMARILDAAGVDSLLVGDSLGMVVQGQPDALAVNLEEMIYHTRMVMRGVRRALVVTATPPALTTASQAAASHGPLGPRSRTRLPGCRPNSSVSTWASWLVLRTVSPYVQVSVGGVVVAGVASECALPG